MGLEATIVTSSNVITRQSYQPADVPILYLINQRSNSYAGLVKIIIPHQPRTPDSSTHLPYGKITPESLPQPRKFVKWIDFQQLTYHRDNRITRQTTRHLPAKLPEGG